MGGCFTVPWLSPSSIFDAEASWALALSGGYGVFLGEGYILLQGMRRRGAKALEAAGHREWERINQIVAPLWAELKAISREISGWGASLDLQLAPDVAAGANALFGELAKHYPGQSDATVVRAILALCRKRLQQIQQEYAADVALYWEAIAAIAEANIATARTPAGERLVRLADLKERLFAPALPALLNKSKRWWVRENSGAGDYRNIAGAIIREAQALAAEAQGGAEAENPVVAVSPGKMRRMRCSGPTPRPTGRG